MIKPFTSFAVITTKTEIKKRYEKVDIFSCSNRKPLPTPPLPINRTSIGEGKTCCTQVGGDKAGKIKTPPCLDTRQLGLEGTKELLRLGAGTFRKSSKRTRLGTRLLDNPKGWSQMGSRPLAESFCKSKTGIIEPIVQQFSILPFKFN